MHLTKTNPSLLLTLILVFHTMSVQAEASHDDDDEVRILDQQQIDSKLGEIPVSPVMCETLGLVGWSLIISLFAYVNTVEQSDNVFIFEASLAGLVTFMASLRNALNSHVAFSLNLALCSTVLVAFMKYLPLHGPNDKGKDGFFVCFVGLGITLGSISSVRTFSDVFVACCAAFGVTLGAHEFLTFSFELQKLTVQELLLLFQFCAVGAELSVSSVIVLNALFGVMVTISLIVITMGIVAFNLETNMKETAKALLFFPCGCGMIASVVLILEMLLGLLKVFAECLLGSFLFYPAFLLGFLMLKKESRKALMKIKQDSRSRFSRLLDLTLF